MSNQVSKDNLPPAELIRAVVAVATELNIARRNWNAYPDDHPVVKTSLEKLAQSFQPVFKYSNLVTLGATRDGLMLDDNWLEKTNRICLNVAQTLFERGVLALVLVGVPTVDELKGFLAILAMKREEILASGGIEKLWQAAGITAMELRAINYDRFKGTEDGIGLQDAGQMPLWEQFVRRLTGSDSSSSPLLTPELLAARINARFLAGDAAGLNESALETVVSFMQQMFEELTEGEGGGGDNLADNSATADKDSELVVFISHLEPTLRRQILARFCENPENSIDDFVTLFSKLKGGVLQETFATAESLESAPPLLQAVLLKMFPDMERHGDSSAANRMETLFQEHQTEAFMPASYNTALIDSLKLGQSDLLSWQEIEGLMVSLQPQSIDSRCSELILQLIIANPEDESSRRLISNLSEMCGHLLELGDYGQVLKVISQAADPRLPQPLRIAMRDAFCRREFLDEILSGLKIWGKPKYAQVTLLIQVLGRVFIEPLLDNMAEEENMSLRRFMMDRVQSFGDAAIPYLLARLSDSRWYVQRNILVMLRGLGTLQDFDPVRPLLKDANQKVRSEAYKLLVKMGDPVALRQMLRDVDSEDNETRLFAISLTDSNSPPAMASKLLQIITTGGYTPVESELKIAAIHALGETGRGEVLPELVKLLSSRSLLSYKALNRIKLEVVRSMERYPAEMAAPLLERIAAGGDDQAIQAAEILRNMRSKGNG